MQEETTKSGVSVLIIEDNIDLCMSLIALFEQSGFATHYETTGKSGLLYATTVAPDCILIDISLPDIDGLEVLSALKLGSSTTNIPAIILSGHNDFDLIQRAEELGCAAFLVKPVDPDILVGKVEILCR